MIILGTILTLILFRENDDVKAYFKSIETDDDRNDACERRGVTMYVAKCKQQSQRFKFYLSMSMFVFCFAGQSTTSAQETYSDCGFLFLEAEGCLVFYEGDVFPPPPPWPTPGILLNNTGDFGHLNYVYVSGLIESCGSFCPVNHVCRTMS